MCINVSILVLMEVTLKVGGIIGGLPGPRVSILVLMEVTLKESPDIAALIIDVFQSLF